MDTTHRRHDHRLASSTVPAPAFALPVFASAAVSCSIVQLPRRWAEPTTVVIAAVAMLAGAVLFALAHTTSGTVLPYLTASAIGARLGRGPGRARHDDDGLVAAVGRSVAKRHRSWRAGAV